MLKDTQFNRVWFPVLMAIDDVDARCAFEIEKWTPEYIALSHTSPSRHELLCGRMDQLQHRQHEARALRRNLVLIYGVTTAVCLMVIPIAVAVGIGRALLSTFGYEVKGFLLLAIRPLPTVVGILGLLHVMPWARHKYVQAPLWQITIEDTEFEAKLLAAERRRR